MRLKLTLAFLYLSVVWGTTYLFIKIGLDYWPTLLMAAARNLLACVTLLGILLLRRGAPGERVLWRGPIFFGIVNGTAMALLFWGERYIPSGQASVLVGTVPVFTMLLSRWWFSEPLTLPRLVGISLGLIGVILAVVERGGAASSGDARLRLLGQAAVLGTAVGYAIAFSAAKHHFKGDLLTNTAIHLGTSGVWLGILSYLLDPSPTRAVLTVPAIGSVLYLAVLGSAIAYWLKSFLLRHLPSVQATYTALANPVVALLLGYFFYGEHLGIANAVGVLLVLLGAWLVTRPTGEIATGTRAAA